MTKPSNTRRSSRFTSNPELRDHAKVASGISLSLTTSGRPVGARVRAFFVDSSETLLGDEFEALKNTHLNEIGVKPIESLASVLPSDQVQSTLSYLAEDGPVVGFFPAQDESLEA